MDERDNILAELDAFHVEVGGEAAKLETIHAERLECKAGCADCCVDDLSVFDVEAELIRRRHKVLLSVMTPHKEGACAFLDDENHCLIYESRPYVCRTQGLPLSWTETRDDGSVREFRDICPLNDEGDPIENLPRESCWTIGTYEGKLAELQRRWGGGDMLRVKLRDLPGD
ncbi:MAG: YkgJ family cysteine cluster protein [Acidobacteria bacterium]|uniref:YkgJ family cysteine cluster protein n=1 Tax=Candidatus Polarisedimenticola svalbardensis TaxID=2886004 RepID=A0A8J7CLN9_9BACT|nr:YkgJ family cysteine cluster protein [Candidatus Polarisedimenticola svalbardensis]